MRKDAKKLTNLFLSKICLGNFKIQLYTRKQNIFFLFLKVLGKIRYFVLALYLKIIEGQVISNDNGKSKVFVIGNVANSFINMFCLLMVGKITYLLCV